MKLLLIVTDPHPLPVQFNTGDVYEIEFDIMKRCFIRDKLDKDELYYLEDLAWRHVEFKIKRA